MESPQQPRPSDHSPYYLPEEIRSNMMTFLVAGGICLYFGFSWWIDAPGSVSEEAAKSWFAVDIAFRWCLRGIGALFLIAAALAQTGRAIALLPGLLAEGAFALLMLAMAVDTTLEARADGQFDPYVILFLILAVVGISGLRRLWTLHHAATTPREQPPDS